jgi:branched-subunit amino acid ABC-type transport system permease component
MGVINMAHGEIMMVGAYSTFMMQNLFQSRFGASGTGFDFYFIAALGFLFCDGGARRLASGTRDHSVSLQTSARIAVGYVGSEPGSATNFPTHLRRGQCAGQLAKLG